MRIYRFATINLKCMKTKKYDQSKDLEEPIIVRIGKDEIQDYVDKEFKELVKAEIDGVEALAHRETLKDTKICVEHFTSLAKKYKLLVTGGSDFHGFGSAGKELGFANFYLKVPYSVLEDLKRKKYG